MARSAYGSLPAWACRVAIEALRVAALLFSTTITGPAFETGQPADNLRIVAERPVTVDLLNSVRMRWM